MLFSFQAQLQNHKKNRLQEAAAELTGAVVWLGWTSRLTWTETEIKLSITSTYKSTKNAKIKWPRMEGGRLRGPSLMGYFRVGSTFSSFNPCPSLRSSAPDDRKQFQYINIVLNNKPKPLFLEFILSEEKFYLFKNISNSLTEPL